RAGRGWGRVRDGIEMSRERLDCSPWWLLIVTMVFGGNVNENNL
nr:hypothetical protein [Tanacetum cinerariifolium]